MGKPAIEKSEKETRSERNRRCILEAAEILLRDGSADFSMRDLASRAGVSFATPFNQFGDKTGIFRALSAHRIAAMDSRFREASAGKAAPERVLLCMGIATEVMLEEPDINRAVMGAMGSPSDRAGEVAKNSRALWALAVGAGEGFEESQRELARSLLPGQLALAFRGALSFWTAGEIADCELAGTVRRSAVGLLLGFLPPSDRAALVETHLVRDATDFFLESEIKGR